MDLLAQLNSSEDEILFQASQKVECSMVDKPVEPKYSDISDEEFELNFDRFYTPKCEAEMVELSKKEQPVRTERSVAWASNLFEKWRVQRNTRISKREFEYQSLSVIPYRLESLNDDELNYCISRFVYEVKKLDGTDFPPKTIRQLVLLLQMYLDEHGKSVKLLSDPAYKELQNSVDKLMKERAEKGLGLHTKQAKVISPEEEDILWEKGLLGDKDGYTLLRTVLYLNGLNFALRSGDEHRGLCHGQLSIGENEQGRYLEYVEKISKNNRRGLKDVRVPRKTSRAYASSNCPERCIVNLYEKYISLCPKDTQEDGPFYLQPLKKVKSGQWFTSLPVGRNPLNGMISTMCKEAGFKGELRLKLMLNWMKFQLSIYLLGLVN